MKKITAIVRPEMLEPIKEALFAKKIRGMTISQIQGCGNQHGWTEYYRGSELVLNMVPKVQFEIVLEDEACDEITQLICDVACTGEVGDGKIFLSPVEDLIRIRTGERGTSAL